MGKTSRRKREHRAASEPSGGGSVEASPREARKRLPVSLGAAIVLLAAMVFYINSLHGVLLFDDGNAIVNNRFVREFDLRRIFNTASWWGELRYGRLYRPVSTLTFAANYALGGTDPLGYHVVNVLLHAGVSLLLLVLFKRISGDAWLSAFSALLFAVHPVHTEAVASVVGRAEELAALFALASWLLLLRGRENSARRGLWLLLASLALAAGFLAKESAATIIGAMICGDVIFYQRYGSSRGEVLKRWAPQYLVLALTVLLLVVLRTVMIGRVLSAPEHMDNVLAGAALPARYLTATAVAGKYFLKLAWPFSLAADYSYRQIDLVGSPADPGFLLGLATLAGGCVVVLWGLRRQPLATFAVALSATTFSLASNMLVPIGTVMAERLLYLPSAGFCLLAAMALRGLASRVLREPRRAWLAASVASGLLALVWGGATWERNKVWREPVTFFEAMVRDAPLSARSHRELALVYSRMGRHEDAIAGIKRSLAIKPGDAATLYNLGNVLMRAGRHQEAIAAYQKSLARKPDFVEAMTNLGNAYSAAGEERAAETWFERGLRLAPGSAAINMNLANSLFRQGRLAEAEKHYRRAVSLDPRAANIRSNYASLLYAQGRYAESAEQYRRATTLDPRSPSAYVGLMAALAAAGRAGEAKRVLSVAVELFPGDPGVERMRALLEKEGTR